MRIEQAQANTEPRDLMVAAVMDLAFVVAALLSIGSAPPKHIASSVERARPAVTELASAMPNRTLPGQATAESRSR